jgi:magnesium-transporting ATPase (P-type)
MPLAISIAMALSINRLKKDNILIKNLEAVQTCAMLHDLCVSKTGTITTGELKVKRFHFINEAKPKDNFPAQICFFMDEVKIIK